MDKWFRAITQSQPRVIFRVPEGHKETVELRLHVPKEKPDGNKNPLIFVSPGVEPKIFGGLPLPFDTIYPIFLEPGDELWALSTGEGLIGAVRVLK